jgi:hypothetical protein
VAANHLTGVAKNGNLVEQIFQQQIDAGHGDCWKDERKNFL